MAAEYSNCSIYRLFRNYWFASPSCCNEVTLTIDPGFNIMRDEMHELFRYIPILINAYVSLVRVQDFLNKVR
jgi:hypothetical protein